MSIVNRPISVTTAFSLLVHAALLLALLQARDAVQAQGKGIAIELVSSSYVAKQRETEQAAKQATASAPRPVDINRPVRADSQRLARQPASNDSIDVARPVADESRVTETIDNDTGEQVDTRSTSSIAQNHSILELLHTSISEHKQYPYLARRQRREGVATIEFILNPDGSINNPRLLNSSRTRSLDKAALDAVRGIEPFMPAKDYITAPEAYRVDVVFNVL